MRPAIRPAFLPSTMAATATTGAEMVRLSAEQADAAAAECWAALLGGCDSPGRRLLPQRLRQLADATAIYAGTAWWYGDGTRLRTRITQARERIEDAVAERDGAEFAEAFIGYDEAVATAVARVGSMIK
ncbi:sugar ABC transporter substrate-binding protein [Kibdelosporangium phytohabitans]|uniref:Sugar ABC transporter substrate-binding protein n=2 Tax=Kibdelosporangium phytohabitans TaxID=860235 RepID=A0A0N9HX23_9PSEU|nr:sugar ABC transporter substrate-binding protein [Kibdelosporangium phytohabitans]